MKDIHIKLISRRKNTNPETGLQSFFKVLLTVIVYPFMVVFGLLAIIFFFILSLFQQKDVTVQQPKEEPWSILTEVDGIRFFKRYKSDIINGPAYYQFRTEPVIPELESKWFGDWLFCFEGGLFLQQWNSTDSPNTTLLYVEVEKRQVKVIKHSIPSVLWDMVQSEDKKLELKCDTGNELLRFEIQLS